MSCTHVAVLAWKLQQLLPGLQIVLPTQLSVANSSLVTTSATQLKPSTDLAEQSAGYTGQLSIQHASKLLC